MHTNEQPLMPTSILDMLPKKDRKYLDKLFGEYRKEVTDMYNNYLYRGVSFNLSDHNIPQPGQVLTDAIIGIPDTPRISHYDIEAHTRAFIEKVESYLKKKYKINFRPILSLLGHEGMILTEYGAVIYNIILQVGDFYKK